MANKSSVKQASVIRNGTNLLNGNSWKFNPNATQKYRQSGKTMAEHMLEQRTRDVINLEHNVNEQDAKNRITFGESLTSLKDIDKNMDQIGKMLTKSRTFYKLPSRTAALRKKVFRDKSGNKMTIGSGTVSVTAKNQN